MINVLISVSCLEPRSGVLQENDKKSWILLPGFRTCSGQYFEIFDMDLQFLTTFLINPSTGTLETTYPSAFFCLIIPGFHQGLINMTFTFFGIFKKNVSRCINSLISFMRDVQSIFKSSRAGKPFWKRIIVQVW